VLKRVRVHGLSLAVLFKRPQAGQIGALKLYP
jgi:hypothetical protein